MYLKPKLKPGEAGHVAWLFPSRGVPGVAGHVAGLFPSRGVPAV